jgi:hypothetical protein
VGNDRRAFTEVHGIEKALAGKMGKIDDQARGFHFLDELKAEFWKPAVGPTFPAIGVRRVGTREVSQSDRDQSGSLVPVDLTGEAADTVRSLEGQKK